VVERVVWVRIQPNLDRLRIFEALVKINKIELEYRKKKNHNVASPISQLQQKKQGNKIRKKNSQRCVNMAGMTRTKNKSKHESKSTRNTHCASAKPMVS
jgi:hypothetical protein